MILCGDLNINLFNPYNLVSIHNFISLLIQYNFYCLINYPTKYNPFNRITDYALLDQIWTNFIPQFPAFGVIDKLITGHLLIFLFFSFECFKR